MWLGGSQRQDEDKTLTLRQCSVGVKFGVTFQFFKVVSGERGGEKGGERSGNGKQRGQGREEEKTKQACKQPKTLGRKNVKLDDKLAIRRGGKRGESGRGT